MKSFEIDNLEKILSSPISQKVALELLRNDEIRDDFLMNYLFFSSDGNRKIYVNWVFENLSSKSNKVIEHVFNFANYCNIVENSILEKAKYILTKKFWKFTKLACLEYLISKRRYIKDEDYLELSTLGFSHSKNEIVKFQAHVNLVICDKLRVDNMTRIKAILKRVKYPTLFYRLVNQLDLLPKDIREKLKYLILKELKFKKFNEGVVEEIKVQLNNPDL